MAGCLRLRALILDGSFKGDEEAKAVRERVAQELTSKGWDVSAQVLHELDIAPCTGCFSCWTSSPGECIIDDEGRTVARGLAQADLWVYITPVTFGGYSSVLKRALDRLIPDLLPFFRKYDGESHHPSRYGKEWDILVFGLLPKMDAEAEEAFRELVHRNALNSHAQHEAAAVILRGAGDVAIEDKVRSTIELSGVLP